MENHANFPLPPEIMVEIFLLLPLESMLTCKLVSKEWNTLFKDPMFIKHYNIESTTFFLRENSLNCLFRRDDDDCYKVHRLPIKLNRYRKEYYHLYEFDLFQHELLVESSNKIACVKTANGHFLLYNLITGDSHVVADAPLRDSLVIQHYSFPYWLFYGFGYDCYDDDYKIIVVCPQSAWLRRFNDLSIDANKYNANSSLIFVYSYRNCDWKLLEGFPHASYMWSTIDDKRAAYSFNGVLYWVVYKQGTEVIAALDLHSYGFAEIVLPLAYYNGILLRDAKLTELNGHLCCSFDWYTFDVWVMKEYGVPESWTMLFSICKSRISFPFYTMKYTVGLYKCRDARKIVVLLDCNSKLELFGYDIDKDEIQVFSKAPRQKRNNTILPQRLKTWFKKAFCFLRDR